MIRRVINTVMLALIFCQSAFAASPLFEIQESGTTLETPAIITICANINGPASCQRYTVRRTNLGIMTTTGRSYTRSGIKMDTSTFKIVNAYCSTTANGYCSLPLNNHTRTDIPITTVGVRLHATPSIHTQVDVTYTQHNITTGGIEPYTYSVVDGQLPAGTNLNTSTGAVSGTPSTPGAFSYTIQVTGALGTTDTASTSGTIATQLVITPTASPDNEVGTAYLQTNVANDGTAPYTFSVASGSIPAGTTLNTATGSVSGTPTTAGAYAYTINVVDSDGGSETTPAITGTISGPVGLTATPSTYTEVNVNYLQTNGATDGTRPFHYTLDSGTLPAGTTLDPHTGTVSGTPTASGTFSYTIKVTDDDAAMAIAATGGTMNAALSTTNPSAVIANAGQTASFSAVASDGTTPYSYQWQVNPATGVFANVSTGSGGTTPTYTTAVLTTGNNGYSYRVVVTDAGSATATSTAATLTVNAALATTTPSNISANVGQTAIFSTTTSSGTGAYSYQWQLSTDAGITFSNIGSATSASYTTPALIIGNNNNQYRVRVTDSASVPSSINSTAATLTVNAALATTTPS
ncbi:MAG: putative Ig domain-containing protein, partial [Gammaproteobacteria bacterium]